MRWAWIFRSAKNRTCRKELARLCLRQFVGMLKAEGHTAIIIDPDPKNTRAVRAYTKAGFKPVPNLAENTQGVLIMQHESNTNEINP